MGDVWDVCMRCGQGMWHVWDRVKGEDIVHHHHWYGGWMGYECTHWHSVLALSLVFVLSLALVLASIVIMVCYPSPICHLSLICHLSPSHHLSLICRSSPFVVHCGHGSTHWWYYVAWQQRGSSSHCHVTTEPIATLQAEACMGGVGHRLCGPLLVFKYLESEATGNWMNSQTRQPQLMVWLPLVVFGSVLVFFYGLCNWTCKHYQHAPIVE